jgi:hypothetical protein
MNKRLLLAVITALMAVSGAAAELVGGSDADPSISIAVSQAG